MKPIDTYRYGNQKHRNIQIPDTLIHRYRNREIQINTDIRHTKRKKNLATQKDRERTRDGQTYICTYRHPHIHIETDTNNPIYTDTDIERNIHTKKYKHI